MVREYLTKTTVSIFFEFMLHPLIIIDTDITFLIHLWIELDYENVQCKGGQIR